MGEEREAKKKAVRIILFCLYLIVLSYLLFFAESFGRGASADYRYNFIPFTEIRRYLVHWERIGIFKVAVNLLGNIAAFMPFGYFLSGLTDNKLRTVSVVLFSMEFSMLVETIQLVSKLGSCDVDDVILNTLGGWLGCLVYKGILEMRKKKDVRRDEKTKKI